MWNILEYVTHEIEPVGYRVGCLCLQDDSVLDDTTDIAAEDAVADGESEPYVI